MNPGEVGERGVVAQVAQADHPSPACYDPWIAPRMRLRP
jgi:hypothetical protein